MDVGATGLSLFGSANASGRIYLIGSSSNTFRHGVDPARTGPEGSTSGEGPFGASHPSVQAVISWWSERVVTSILLGLACSATGIEIVRTPAS
jgi:hypothetical protein